MPVTRHQNSGIIKKDAMKFTSKWERCLRIEVTLIINLSQKCFQKKLLNILSDYTYLP